MLGRAHSPRREEYRGLADLPLCSERNQQPLELSSAPEQCGDYVGGQQKVSEKC
jgi:hypothetical protein